MKTFAVAMLAASTASAILVATECEPEEPVVLLERPAQRAGAQVEDGFTWEEGPNSFATQPSIVRIADELGIADELVFADESLPPWVNHNGKLHPLPKGKGGKGPKGQLELVFDLIVFRFQRCQVCLPVALCSRLLTQLLTLTSCSCSTRVTS